MSVRVLGSQDEPKTLCTHLKLNQKHHEQTGENTRHDSKGGAGEKQGLVVVRAIVLVAVLVVVLVVVLLVVLAVVVVIVLPVVLPVFRLSR